MPEGDTIFRTARTLHRALAGQTVTHFETVYAQLSNVDDQAPIRGRMIESVSAMGKHCLIRFSDDLVLRTHLRMNGSWHIYRPGEKWQLPRFCMRILIETASFVAVGFNIPVAEFSTERGLARQADIRAMGPDLLSDAFEPAEAFRRLRQYPMMTMGEALLNQRIMAGIGNEFKSEILFAGGVHPFATVGQTTDAELEQLIHISRKYLATNVLEASHPNAIAYSGKRRTTGRTDPAERLWVYGRSNEPCRKCKTAIEYAKQGIDARVTFWCPTCQRSRAAAPV